MHERRIGPGSRPSGLTRYRVWITALGTWRPQDCRDVPPEAVALEPAEEGVMSGRRAAAYVRAFNRAALGRGAKVWAVALPVAVRYEGEPEPGQRLAPAIAGPRRAQEKSPPHVSQASTRDGLPPRE